MRAISLNGYGGPDVMHWDEAPDPVPAPGQVLIDVIAAGVNRADLLQRQGLYPPPPGASEILGLECSGTVAGLGDGVLGWEIGQPVCALLAGGGYAERVAVPVGQVLPLPDGVAAVDAASLPEVAATVWSNLVMSARLRPGQLLLVHGGGSGIGTHAIQVAVALGARVAVTAGSRHKLERCAELGASILINYQEEDFAAIVGKAGGADVILDNMGAAYLSRNVTALAPDGQLIIIGLQGGAKGELNLGAAMAKRAVIRSTGLRARPLVGPASKADIIADVRTHLWPLIEEGLVKPVVHARLPIADAAAAHRLLDEDTTVGKVILQVS